MVFNFFLGILNIYFSNQWKVIIAKYFHAVVKPHGFYFIGIIEMEGRRIW